MTHGCLDISKHVKCYWLSAASVRHVVVQRLGFLGSTSKWRVGAFAPLTQTCLVCFAGKLSKTPLAFKNMLGSFEFRITGLFFKLNFLSRRSGLNADQSR